MRIGVLAAQAGITAKTIRFYEDTGLMPAPARTPAGYRDYPAGAAARLAFIRDAQAAGLTLAEIRSILVIRDDGQPPASTSPTSPTSTSPRSASVWPSSPRPGTRSAP
jgi:DNA-binding transcriptional MerR regulator